MNSIPKEIKSPTRIYKGLYVIDFGFVVMFWSFFSIFEDYVNLKVNLIYQIFNVIVALYLIRSSRNNIGRKIIHSLVFSLIKDKRVYHADYSYTWKEKENIEDETQKAKSRYANSFKQ